MGKTGKWLKSILTGKRDNKEKEKTCHYNIVSPIPYESHNPTTPISTPTPKEKKRWSFRRSSAAPKDVGPTDHVAVTIMAPSAPLPPASVSSTDAETEQKKHAMAIAAATAAAADAAVAAAEAAAVVIRLTAASASDLAGPTNTEDVAAIKIQSVFRSYLARKALCALKGLVKLQALVRGHLVRKQATATLRCMQALVTAQARARAQRIRAGDDSKPDFVDYHRTSTHRKSVHDNWLRNPYHDIDMGNMEENIKIVEMDINATKATTKSRNSYSNSHPSTPQPERADQKLSTTNHLRPPSSGGRLTNCHVSPAQSTVALTEMSPRAHSGHFEDYSFCPAAQSSPLHSYAESLSYDFPMPPNYMANTLSSRAKARSQSAPKARPTDALERQPSTGGRRRSSMEGPGRNVPPRAVRMQRSSSHAGPAAVNYQYPWSIVKLDRSAVSLKDSECGSTSTVLTNTHYCRSLVAFDIHGQRY